jgi:hypothetical protein
MQCTESIINSPFYALPAVINLLRFQDGGPLKGQKKSHYHSPKQVSNVFVFSQPSYSIFSLDTSFKKGAEYFKTIVWTCDLSFALSTYPCGKFPKTASDTGLLKNSWIRVCSAETLNAQLEQLNSVPELGLQLLFFDGEEQLYTNTMFGPDGIYGSKHLGKQRFHTKTNSLTVDTLLTYFSILKLNLNYVKYF